MSYSQMSTEHARNSIHEVQRRERNTRIATLSIYLHFVLMQICMKSHNFSII